MPRTFPRRASETLSCVHGSWLLSSFKKYIFGESFQIHKLRKSTSSDIGITQYVPFCSIIVRFPYWNYTVRSLFYYCTVLVLELYSTYLALLLLYGSRIGIIQYVPCSSTIVRFPYWNYTVRSLLFYCCTVPVLELHSTFLALLLLYGSRIGITQYVPCSSTVVRFSYWNYTVRSLLFYCCTVLVLELHSTYLALLLLHGSRIGLQLTNSILNENRCSDSFQDKVHFDFCYFLYIFAFISLIPVIHLKKKFMSQFYESHWLTLAPCESCLPNL